jgi:hypothetical protein
MPSTLRRIDDPHDATIAPDIIPADWAGHAPQAPANDAISREKLFAEIRHAAETAAPAIDNNFRATDVNDIPARRKKSRAWIKSAAMAFGFALISAFAAAAWKHHGDAATEAAANWVPLLGASSSQAGDSPAGQQSVDAAAQPATDQPADAAQPASTTAALPPEAEQQIQSMARDMAAMGQQIEQLKATIAALKANQQTATAAPPPVVRTPAPPPKPKVSALPPRPPAPPPASPPRPAYSPAVQASAAPPPVAAAPPPQQAYPAPPPAYAPPPQATVQPNGEPIVRPPMPMPLSDRY